MFWFDLQDILTVKLGRLHVPVLERNRRPKEVGTGMPGCALQHLLDAVYGLIEITPHDLHLGQSKARTNAARTLSQHGAIGSFSRIQIASAEVEISR